MVNPIAGIRGPRHLSRHRGAESPPNWPGDVSADATVVTLANAFAYVVAYATVIVFARAVAFHQWGPLCRLRGDFPSRGQS
jgi:hypothetical protein